VQKWLDNPRHQGVKRDIGELLTPSKYPDECDLEDEADEPTASDLDFIDDSELVNGKGEMNGMQSPQSLSNGGHIQWDSDESSDDELLLVPSGVVADDIDGSEMGDSEEGYSSDVEDNPYANESPDEECLKERPKKASRKRGKKPVSEYVLSSHLHSMYYVDRSSDSSAASWISLKMMASTAMIPSLTNLQTRHLSLQVCFLDQDVEDYPFEQSLQPLDGKRARLPRRKPKKRQGPPQDV